MAKKVKIEKINKLLKAHKFDKIKKAKAGDDEPESCCICVMEFSGSEIVKQTPCKHLFHNDGLFQWIDTKINEPDCPFCRTIFNV
jgi:hypothetical protein